MAGTLKRETLINAAVAALLVAVGGVAWWLQLQPSLRVDAAELAALPSDVSGWQGRELPLAGAVEAELSADLNIQREYVREGRPPIWLYVGYYGTAAGGRPRHTPRGCYTGAGWGIEATAELGAGPGGALRVTEYRVEQQGHRRLVHFWYRSHRRTGLRGGLDQNLDRLLGRLLRGRADGALVRLSTPLGSEDPRRARERLLRFAAEIDPLIGARWPEETRES